MTPVRAVVGAALVVLLFVVAVWLGTYWVMKPRDGACEAALRVGMGDSGAAEVSALKSPACAELSDDALARVRARVEVQLLRQAQP